MVSSQGRVLLAYSGGLDTSCILAWLIEQGYEVVAFMADVGQEEDFKAAEAKALKVGATKFVLKDLKREFVTELITPAVQANCIYEGVYLLGTSLARPVIARGMIEAATPNNAPSFHMDVLEGKRPSPIRTCFLRSRSFNQGHRTMEATRVLQRFAGRSDLLKYAEEKGIPVFQTAAKPWSTDENLHHISFEAGILEEPDDLLEASADGPQCIDLTFTRGVTSELIVYKPSTEQREVLGKATDVLEIFLQLNSLARATVLAESTLSRTDSLVSRVVAATRLLPERFFVGTHGFEGLTLDGKVRALRDSFVTAELSKILYNGYWFSPEREFVQSALEASQKNVNGRVRLSLYKGNVIVDGRASNEGSTMLGKVVWMRWAASSPLIPVASSKYQVYMNIELVYQQLIFLPDSSPSKSRLVLSNA
ncbi:hypothetical protein H4Q26_014672 [Puccinia striiformis f. sp. tritici PST-130]|nr:hypothetical protein H4Q26_014672 [Puccinia striiformis f. sp. tritici PST-130]